MAKLRLNQEFSKNKIIFSFCLALVFPQLCFSESVDLLKVEPPIAIEGKPGRFDFMATDFLNKRILAAHKENKTLEVLDLESHKFLHSVHVGSAQGVAIDKAQMRYFLGNEDEHSIVVVDAKKLNRISEIKLNGPVDAIAFDDEKKLLYVAEDAGKHIWVVNPEASKVVATIEIPGVPEVLEVDQATQHLYVNIKDKSLLVTIDTVTNKLDKQWPTWPVIHPHGLTIDKRRGRAYVAGENAKIISVDLKTGKVLSTSDIKPRCDQIVFDDEKQNLFSACKTFVSITKVSDTGLKFIGDVSSPEGAHTLAIDPLSHGIWISYADSVHSFFQNYKIIPEGGL